MSLQLNIDYPENLPDAIGVPREQFEQEARWAMAIKLFEMKRLSSGQAATLVGTDRRMATIRELKGHIDLKEMYSNSLAHIT
jgi:predicted HTH domain antitoxin